jgi:hypothetical protein
MIKTPLTNVRGPVDSAPYQAGSTVPNRVPLGPAR